MKLLEKMRNVLFMLLAISSVVVSILFYKQTKEFDSITAQYEEKLYLKNYQIENMQRHINLITSQNKE